VTEYRIVVGAATQGGWRNLHTFDWNDEIQRWIPSLGWLAEKTSIAAGDASIDSDGNFDAELFLTLSDSPGFKADPRRSAQRIQALADPAGAFHLNTDAVVPLPILSVIFDVLRAHSRHRANIDDIKVVVSKYGSRILALDGLPDHDRQHAAELLHQAVASIVLPSSSQ
jgi:hypothetical protein